MNHQVKAIVNKPQVMLCDPSTIPLDMLPELIRKARHEWILHLKVGYEVAADSLLNILNALEQNYEERKR